MDINNKLLEIIREQLPEAVAGELKEFITNANKDKIELDKVFKKNEELLKENTRLRNELANYANRLHN